jgi:glycosyltransferase involved in cell wall biosynthesis
MHVVRVVAKLEPGGAQLALLRLCKALHHRYGVQTTLLVGEASVDGLRLAALHGVTVDVFSARHPHPTKNLQWMLSWPFAAWLQTRLVDADLVHAHMVGAWWAVAQVLDPRTPFVATEHNQVNWTLQQMRELRPAAAGIDRFFAMGPAAHRFAETAGVRPEIIRDARSAVAGLNATPARGLPLPRVTFAGRLCEDKGPDLLLEALGLIRDQPFSAYLLGAGPLRDKLLHRVRTLGLAERVFLPGWTDKPWSVIAGSSVQVVPSREEAWSQSAVLGLGLGVPVVGFAVDGLVDTLAGSRGVLVPPADPRKLAAAIGAVLAGTTVTDRSSGVRYARLYTPSRVADYYFGEYSQLLAGTFDADHPLLTGSGASR